MTEKCSECLYWWYAQGPLIIEAVASVAMSKDKPYKQLKDEFLADEHKKAKHVAEQPWMEAVVD